MTSNRPRPATRSHHGSMLLGHVAERIMPVLAQVNEAERGVLLGAYQDQLEACVREIVGRGTTAGRIMLKCGPSIEELELEIVLRLCHPYVTRNMTINIRDLIREGAPVLVPQIFAERILPGALPGDFAAIGLYYAIDNAYNVHNYIGRAGVIAEIFGWKPAIDVFAEKIFGFMPFQFDSLRDELRKFFFRLAIKRFGSRIEPLLKGTEGYDAQELRYLACGHEPEIFRAENIVEDLESWYQPEKLREVIFEKMGIV